MFKTILILTMILSGTGASESTNAAANVAKIQSISVEDFYNKILCYFYVFSGSKYYYVTNAGSVKSFASMRYDWKFSVESGKLYLNYVGNNLVEDNLPGISKNLKNVTKYEITPAGLKTLEEGLKTDGEFKRACQIRNADQGFKGHDGKVGTQNYVGESEVFVVEAMTGTGKVIIEMKKSLFNENILYGFSNQLSQSSRIAGIYRGVFNPFSYKENDCSDCLYVISITDPKSDLQ